MKTFLLKMGCLFLFGFIFYQAIQVEHEATNPPLLNQETSVEFIQSETATTTADLSLSLNHNSGLLTNR